MYVAYWKPRNTKKHKTSNRRYLTRSLIKELKDKGHLFHYKCNLHLDEPTRNE